MANTINNGYSGTPDPFQQGRVNSLQVACGSGFGTTPTVYQCGAAIQIVNNGQALTSGAFKVGLSFLNSSLVAQTIFGGPTSVAIAMPPSYGMYWYSGAGAPLGGMEMTGSGQLVIAANSLNMNGSSGQTKTCTSLPTVVNGIVTSC